MLKEVNPSKEYFTVADLKRLDNLIENLPDSSYGKVRDVFTFTASDNEKISLHLSGFLKKKVTCKILNEFKKNKAHTKKIQSLIYNCSDILFQLDHYINEPEFIQTLNKKDKISYKKQILKHYLDSKIMLPKKDLIDKIIKFEAYFYMEYDKYTTRRESKKIYDKLFFNDYKTLLASKNLTKKESSNKLKI